MKVPAFMTRVNYNLRGTDDDAPAEDTDDYNYWLDTMNRKKNELYEDITKQWRFSFTTKTIDTGTQPIIAAAVATFNLDVSFLGAANIIYIVDLAGQKHYYDIIEPQSVGTSSTQEVYIDGMNPEVLNFTQPIVAGDPIIGGTIYIPGYYMPDDVADEDTDLPFANPDWVCMAVAAEVAFNDLTYEDKAPDLNNKANNLYSLMVKRNRRGTTNRPRTASNGYNRNRIRAPRVRR